MVDHSHNWFEEVTTREGVNDNSDYLNTMKPKENNAIQASKEAHPTKECPLKKEDKAIEQHQYMGSLEEKAYQLTQIVLTNTVEKDKTMGKENMKKPVPRDLPPTLFLGSFKKQMGTPCRTHKTVCTIRNPEEMKAQEDEGEIDEQDHDTPLHDGVKHPFPHQTAHITPPDDDYVAPATNPIFDKQLNKFEEEFSNIAKVAEKANDNPVKDVKELSHINTYDCETFILKLLHQVCSLEALTRLHSSTWATKWFKMIVAYAKCNCDSYESEL
ncbi:hypothetical protein Tco_1035876, partial [Tanacetum coccineum]